MGSINNPAIYPGVILPGPITIGPPATAVRALNVIGTSTNTAAAFTSGASTVATFSSTNAAGGIIEVFNGANSLVGMGSADFLIGGNFSDGAVVVSGPNNLWFGGNGIGYVEIQNGGNTVFTAGIGIFGNAAPAQVVGWGTPTGNAAVANFPGAAATLLQTSTAVAQIIATLKAVGHFGA